MKTFLRDLKLATLVIMGGLAGAALIIFLAFELIVGLHAGFVHGYWWWLALWVASLALVYALFRAGQRGYRANRG